MGLVTKLLDGIHDFILLIDNRRSQLPGPVQIIVHQVDDF
jgi:hypothetical protein